MTSVFISYSSKDREAATAIATWLSEHRVDVFIDYQKLIGGEEFTDRLAGEIEERDYLLALVSENSLNSRWVIREIQHADRHGKEIIPVRLDMTPYPSGLAFIIGGLHYIDFIAWHTLDNHSSILEKLAPCFNITLNPHSKVHTDLRIIKDETAANISELKVITEVKSYPSSLAFSATGNLLAAGFGRILLGDEGKSNGFIKVWQAIPGELLAHFRGHSQDVQSIAFALSDNIVASGSLDGTIRVWDISNNKSRIYSQKHSVLKILFADLDKVLLSALSNGEVLQWNLKSRKPEVIYKFEEAIESIALSRGNLLAIASENMITIWDRIAKSEVGKFTFDDNKIRCLAFSPDELLLAYGGNDRTIRLLDTSTWREIARLEGHHNFVRSICFSPDGSLLVSGSNDGTVRLWNVKNRNQIRVFTEHIDVVFAVAFSPDSTLIASASYDRTIKLRGLKM